MGRLTWGPVFPLFLPCPLILEGPLSLGSKTVVILYCQLSINMENTNPSIKKKKFKLKIDSSLEQYIPTTDSFSPCLLAAPHLSSTQDLLCPYFLFRNEWVYKGQKLNRTKQDNKTRQNPSYWGWTQQPNRRKQAQSQFSEWPSDLASVWFV